MFSKEPDPNDCLDAKNMFEPDPDDSQVGECSNSKLYLGTHGACQGPYTYGKPDPDDSQENSAIHAEPDPDDKLGVSGFDSFETSPSLEVLSSWMGCVSKTDIVSSDVNASGHDAVAIDASQENSNIRAEPDPDDCQGNSAIHAEPEPDDSQENSAIHAEPDPDDPQENSAICAEPDPGDSQENDLTHAEPDPDVSQENDFMHAEPDPDDSQENDFMHAEPDPDDKLGVSGFTDSFETLPALEVVSSLMVYVSEPDIVSSSVDASGNDASRVMPVEAAKLLGTLVKVIEEMINYHGQTFFRSLHEAYLQQALVEAQNQVEFRKRRFTPGGNRAIPKLAWFRSQWRHSLLAPVHIKTVTCVKNLCIICKSK